MQKIRYVHMSLIAIAMFSGCSTVPPENPSLNDAHSTYDSARSNPQVTKLAALELQDAGETLNKADTAWSKRKGNATVNQLAYLAKQKVAIAQETTKRKAAELEIAGASAKRDKVRLEARTAEADAAKKRAELAQQTADQRSVALAAAGIKTKQDQTLIAARIAEVEEAKKQAAMAQESADKQAAALAEASAKAEHDQTFIAARMAEVEEAKRQAAMAQKSADKQTEALAEAQAMAERNQALIAEQEMQLKKLQAKKTDRGMVITLGDVLFNVNKAKLSGGGINNVKKLADFLNKYPQRKVMIEGHTDSTGSDSYNQALSEKRANAVQAELVDMGISSDRIATRGYGEASPVATNDTAAGRQINRRVEIILSDDAGNIVPHDKNPE
ncbi:MAG: OmpA family protein [Candidatus Nitrotoga sp.]